MPELPEVERAARLFKSLGQGRRISRVDTAEDTIIYSGVTHDEFAKEVEGRVLLDAGRYGKVFFLTLDGDKRMPVLHLGMTGMLMARGQEAVYYRKKPNIKEGEWPPKFMKFVMHFEATEDKPEVEIAFMDARRLGRIRLCADPQKEPPISALGFDPILCMPTLEEFTAKVAKRGCPIKALLLDQSFSAGVGNWIADEVLFHAAIHPEQVAKTLSTEQMEALHKNIRYVCQTAVDVNADASKFPSHWLFSHRWGKGKAKSTLVLPSGEKANIKWITVGGRTSAYVQQIQKLEGGVKGNKKSKSKTAKESDSSAQSSSEKDDEPVVLKKANSRKRKNGDTETGSRKRSTTLKRSGMTQVVEGLTLDSD